MADPYVGEIRMFAGNFAPRGWALCDGQLLAINQNDALFALFGTYYGGDGRTTFGLPDLRGRLPIHQGQGPGLTRRNIGSKSGGETVTVTGNQMPEHSHAIASTDAADRGDPGGKLLGDTGTTPIYADAAGSSVSMDASAASRNVGGGQPHTNLMPFLCINFIVSLVGVFPSRN